MPEPNKPLKTVTNTSSLEDFLKANLKKHLGRIKKMENGGGLHGLVVSMVERQLIKLVMEETKDNQSQAAHILGLNRNTLRRKLEHIRNPDGKKKKKKTR